MDMETSRLNKAQKAKQERSETPKMLDDLLMFPEWQKSLEEDNFPYTLRGSGWYLW